MKQNYKRTEIYWYYYTNEYPEYGDNSRYTHRYRYMRTPRTHLNRKRLAAYPEFTRGKQRNLPSSWDDKRQSFSYGKVLETLHKEAQTILLGSGPRVFRPGDLSECGRAAIEWTPPVTNSLDSSIMVMQQTVNLCYGNIGSSPIYPANL